MSNTAKTYKSKDKKFGPTKKVDKHIDKKSKTHERDKEKT